MSYLTFGKIGDIFMTVLTIYVVVVAVSAQIQSLSAIFMYDIYKTYISPFHAPFTTRAAKYCDEDIADYLKYNGRNVIVRHVITVFFCIISYPAGLIYVAIQIDYTYKVFLVAVIVASCVLPVCLSIMWHRTTGPGVVIGIMVGLIVGFGAWLLYASMYPGGLTEFIANTTRTSVLITFMVTAFLSGGIFCALVSLCSGGLCREAEVEWELCLRLDNPAKPWALQYADVYPGCVVEAPSYKQVRPYF